MDITLKDAKTCDGKSLRTLYESVGWFTYTKDLKRFSAMFDNAFDVIGAFENDQLIGLIRVLSDGAHILYVQDLLVRPEKQRQGVGKRLLMHVLNKYKHIRQKVLITDADTLRTQAFYRNCGLKEASESNITCFLTMT